MTLDIDSLREGWDFEAKLAIGKYGRGQLPKSQHKDPSSQHKDPSSQHKDPSSQHKDASSQHKDASSQHKAASSQHKAASSQHKETSSQQREADSGQANIPTVAADLYPLLVQEIRGRQRSQAGKMENALLALCADRYVMAQELAEILQRSMETLKNHYISKLVQRGKLELRFPEQPTHPAQAYRTTVAGIPKGHNNDDSGNRH